ncbi:MAG: RHS repeat domain-containing protein [Bacteroidales bacterium]
MRLNKYIQTIVIAINEKLEPCYNGSDEDEKLQYFYHPDHLGSSSFITDATGYAVQHLQYLPFGETFVDQQNGYDSRYTFSAKEKDDETQYSYFGARYYDSDLSVWLSVDPLSDKYPSLSPYTYCANNPVMLVDPDGMASKKPDDYFDEVTGVYLGNDKNLGVKTDDVRTISKEKWESLQSNTNQPNRQKVLSLHTAGKKLNWKKPVSAAVAKGIANHYCKEAGYSLSDLKCSSVEIMGGYTYSTNQYGQTTKSQNPIADIDLLESGKLKLRVNGTSYGSSNGNGLFNRWDFISLFQHERGMHGSDWLSGKEYNEDTKYSWEARAYNFQINTNWTTFKKTSSGFQYLILQNAAEFGVYPIFR